MVKRGIAGADLDLERTQDYQMAIRLTPEQEQRLQAVVNAGAYASAEDALNAALTVVERAAAHDFQGTQEELEGLLMAGLASKELSEEEFWHSVDSQTIAMLTASKSGPRE
jgi:Arc/MetJ-type ribon-helix-helix transcriptional regulator